MFEEPLLPPPPFPPPPFPPPNPVGTVGGIVGWATVVWVVREGVVEIEKRDDGDASVDVVESDISSRRMYGERRWRNRDSRPARARGRN